MLEGDWRKGAIIGFSTSVFLYRTSSLPILKRAFQLEIHTVHFGQCFLLC